MRPRNPAVPRRLAASLLLLPLLTGCFAAGSGSADPAAGDGGSGSGARLRVAMAFPPAERMSPYGDDGVLLSRLAVTEGLTSLDTDGAAAPALAASWKRDGDRDWTFTLRQAAFQDGTEVTAENAAAALRRATEADPAPRALSGVDLQVEAAGPRTLRITTAAPDPILPQRLANPSLAVLSPKAYGADGRVDPAGHATGPFTLTRLDGTRSATLQRFDRYWGSGAEAAGIDVQFVADGTARANALRSGAVDVAEAVPVAQVPLLADGTAREVPTVRTSGLYLNTRKGAFKDPALRAAARAAIRPAELARGVYEGHADPGQGLFGPAVAWAEGKRVQPTGRARPAEADTVHGRSIVLATYSNRPELPETAAVLQQQLRKAGFTVRLEVREYSRIESDALAGAFDAFILPRAALLDTGDPVSFLASDFTCGSSFNLAQLCDKTVDAAVASAAAIGSTGARQDAVMRAEAAVLATDAMVPLVHQRVVQGVAAGVRGVLLDPYERTLVGTGTHR
ncbi:ABC transporter substrate-binding protein [Peterkaempfera bronchialis]|uniref:ABC transporter substrate-binding protein n=1 Tax=Peterkaempfera bronchialis TaxID=2126346 RepID=A0A345SZG6_9ACTN|nr:ABC transporter substrate-binding protein [Peterkaempfera bronchialis]AXI79121.1 ABC transporter substrate-binding protein [Peterkaempfera bronchialis]